MILQLLMPTAARLVMHVVVCIYRTHDQTRVKVLIPLLISVDGMMYTCTTNIACTCISVLAAFLNFNKVN